MANARLVDTLGPDLLSVSRRVWLERWVGGRGGRPRLPDKSAAEQRVLALGMTSIQLAVG